MLIALIGVKLGGRGRVYKFRTGHRRLNYMEALMGEGGEYALGKPKKGRVLEGFGF